MQVLIRQKDVEGAPKGCDALRDARTLTSKRFDLPEPDRRRASWAMERRECRRQAIRGCAQAWLPASADEWVIGGAK